MQQQLTILLEINFHFIDIRFKKVENILAIPDPQEKQGKHQCKSRSSDAPFCQGRLVFKSFDLVKFFLISSQHCSTGTVYKEKSYIHFLLNPLFANDMVHKKA